MEAIDHLDLVHSLRAVAAWLMNALHRPSERDLAHLVADLVERLEAEAR